MKPFMKQVKPVVSTIIVVHFNTTVNFAQSY
jgi:hypothetical protein